MSKKGFTLIELLVVIAVIGILASIILVGLSAMRAKGRDTRRINDMKQVQNALELYFTKYGKYPDNSDWAALRTLLTSAATGIGVNQLPNDPNSNQSPPQNYGYCTNSPDQNRYTVGAKLEEAGNPNLADQGNTSFACSPAGLGAACSSATSPTQVYCVTI